MQGEFQWRGQLARIVLQVLLVCMTKNATEYPTFVIIVVRFIVLI